MEPEVVLEINKQENYKVKLIKYYDYEVDRLVNAGFEKKCELLNIKVSKNIYTDELIIYNIKMLQLMQ